MHKANSLRTAPTSTLRPTTVSDRRITGRRLQARRLAVWEQNPRCASCQRVVAYPSGFELDHIVPLFMGGEDVQGNCQILCVHIEYVDGQRVKSGCHAAKTQQEQ